MASSRRKHSMPEVRSDPSSRMSDSIYAGGDGNKIKVNRRDGVNSSKNCDTDIPSVPGSTMKVLPRDRDNVRRNVHSAVGDGDVQAVEVLRQPLLKYPNEDNPLVWYKYLMELEQYVRKRLDSYKNAEDFYRDSEDILQICRHILESAKKIFLLDHRHYVKYSVDQKVWKTALYDIISIIRQGDQTFSANKTKNSAQEIATTKLVEMGYSHFQDLIQASQAAFSIDLTAVLNKADFLSDCYAEMKLSVELIYKFFVYIGDLNRYGMIMKPTRFYRQRALNYYEMARLCDVQKGRAFNQLGIIATYMGDTIGIVYNFTRAYIAPVPAEGSRMKLLDIYDYAYKEHLKLKDGWWYSLSKTVDKYVRWERNFKRQIWLYPRNKKRPEPPPLKSDPPTKEQHIKALSSSELFNRFTTTYVLFLGKMFTKIGMDSLDEVAEECLVYFEGLLKANLKISNSRIAQIAGMLVYILDSVDLKDCRLNGQYSQMKHIRTIAVQFLLEMFSIVAERLLKLTLLSDWDNPQMEFLSTALMLWCDWMKRNRSDWIHPHCRPKFSIRRLELSRDKNKKNLGDDVWIIFAQLMTRLEVILNRVNKYIFPSVSKIQREDCNIELSPLPEVIVLQKFSSCILSPVYKVKFFSSGRFSETRAHVFIRLNTVRSFGSEYATKKYRLLSRRKSLYNAFRYRSVVKLVPPPNDSVSCGLDERHFLYWAEELFAKKEKFKVLRPDCNSARIILRNKIKEVRNAPPPCPKHLVHKIWFLLGESGYHADIVVKPLRVILDTNCFIQQFECVKKLLQYFHRPVLLPVSVVLELKGLSKGGLRTRYRERFSKLDTPEALEKFKQGNETAEIVKIALEFINSNMKYFQVVTTTGRVLKLANIYERIQDDFYNPKERNDDRILDTCRFIEGHDKELRARDTPRRIFRNTVLLTGDRCLRIRTSVLDIPARDIKSFLYWVAVQTHPMTPMQQSPFIYRKHGKWKHWKKF